VQFKIHNYSAICRYTVPAIGSVVILLAYQKSKENEKSRKDVPRDKYIRQEMAPTKLV
jgi:hypothetical protein